MVLNATIFQFVVAVSFIGEETPEDPGIQSVPITTDVVRSTPDQGEVNNIM
jgi:hypothetical protein